MEEKTKRKMGRPPLAEESVRLQAFVDVKLVRRMQHIAVDRGVLPTAIYREAFAEYVARHEAAQK